jgi:hypothetical protein
MKKHVERKLDKIRKFRLSFMAQSRIEKNFGKPFGKIDMDELMAEDFAYILWATLEQADREKIDYNQGLIKLYVENSETKHFVWWKAFKAVDPKNTPNWTGWKKLYENTII